MRGNFTYIENVDALWTWCKGQKMASEVAVDTEFERHSTYYPELCLVQLATKMGIALVDPIKCQDMTPLTEFLNSTERMKVLLRCASGFGGDGSKRYKSRSLFRGYAVSSCPGRRGRTNWIWGVGEKIIKINLDKNQQRANWKRRPLPKIQLDYSR